MQRNTKGQFINDINSESYCGFGIWYDKKGYANIFINNKVIKLHVFIWEQKHGEKPVNHEIHHKDFNKRNYNIDNLELLTLSDHRKIHFGWIKTNGIWSHKPCTKCKKILPLSSFYQRKGYTPSALCKKCHCINTKKWTINNPIRRKEIARNWAKNHRRDKVIKNA